MITVKYLAPTETKGARWKARRAGLTATVNRNYHYDGEHDAVRAAEALVEGWGECVADHWKPFIFCGCTDKGEYCFMSAKEAKERAENALAEQGKD